MGQPKRLGTLAITIVSGKDLKPPSTVGKSDPYVKVRIGGTEKVTAVVKDAKNNPTFNETFQFEISTEKEVSVRLVRLLVYHQYCMFSIYGMD